MAKRLSTVGLHRDVQHSGVPPDDAGPVLLPGLTEHSQQLIGYHPVQHRDDHHGNHEGQEGVDLFREEKEGPVKGIRR